MRLTNKRIIEELLPKLHEFVREFQAGKYKLNEVDYYGKKCYKRFDGNYFYYIEDYNQGYYLISVEKRLKSQKYDKALIETFIHKENMKVCYDDEEGCYIANYTKEFKGMGNGFYATLDFKTGKILFSEWD